VCRNMSRLAAVCYNVKGLKKSVDYYQKHFKMQPLFQSDKQVLIGYGGTVIQLIDGGAEKYDLGTAFGHIAIKAEDLYGMCAKIKEEGGNLTREPGPVKGGKTEIAFVEAPEGFKFEIIARDSTWQSPMLHLMLRVGDLDKTSHFYEGLGMKELRRSENQDYKYSLQFIGFDVEEKSTVFEFTYNWGKSASEYVLGDAYLHSIIALENLDTTKSNLEKLGYKIQIETDEYGRKFQVHDPTNYKLICYDLQAAEAWLKNPK